MLALRQSMYRLLADDPVIAAACGGRIRPDRLERGDAFPAIRMSWSAGDDDEDLAGAATQREYRLQIDCYGSSRVEASTLADRVEELLEGARRQVGTVFIESATTPTRQDLFDPPRDASDVGAFRELLQIEITARL